MVKKKIIVLLVTLMLFAMVLSSCATMFHTTQADIISRSGSTAPIEVRENGVVIYDGSLPARFPVKPNMAYSFIYQTAGGEKREGFLARKFNPFVIGSFLLGGLPVLIDVITGSILQWEKTTGVP